MDHSLYETDFFSWTLRQAELLRAGQPQRADLANIAEEIETLGRLEESKLESAYMLIGMHLLKYCFSPSVQLRAGVAPYCITGLQQPSCCG